ncbi:MAG: DUF2911 domain-containing protein [Lewinellaceae bacterium]|nr:DUF2911 domain-containing protein [Lewinellaceae bacterium]
MKKLIAISLFLMCRGLSAQFLVGPPDGDNQASTTTQSISNVAWVTVQYSSPDVNGREGTIWGQLVPFGQVWRAGANENTTLELSVTGTVQGHSVPAGKYGLFMIPGESEWVVILSKTNSAWGAFVYDEKEDLLRFTVKPQAAEYHEYLTFEFTERKPEYTVLTLKWERLSVAFKIEFPVHELVIESFKAQLKGDIGLFFWEGANQAAQYCLENSVFLEQGLDWAEQSVQIKPQFPNLVTKSRLLEKLGKPEAATAAFDMALKMASPNDLYYHGRSLLAKQETEQAMDIFKRNYERYGDMFLTHLGMGRGYRAKEDYSAALKHFRAALKFAELPRQKTSLEKMIAEMEVKIKR